MDNKSNRVRTRCVLECAISCNCTCTSLGTTLARPATLKTHAYLQEGRSRTFFTLHRLVCSWQFRHQTNPFLDAFAHLRGCVCQSIHLSIGPSHTSWNHVWLTELPLSSSITKQQLRVRWKGTSTRKNVSIAQSPFHLFMKW